MKLKKKIPNPNKLPEVSISEDGQYRHLHLSSLWIQGSMHRKDATRLVHEYIARMMAFLLFFDPAQIKTKHAVQLGLGAASLTKFCSQKLGMKTTAVEINEQVYAACRAQFALPENGDNLTVLIEDATLFVKEELRHNTVDAMQVDLYDEEASSPLFSSTDFYEKCRTLLTDEGILTLNVFGTKSVLVPSLQHLKEAFGSDAVLAFPPTNEGNRVLLARKKPEPVANTILIERAGWIEQYWGLPATTWIKLLKLHR